MKKIDSLNLIPFIDIMLVLLVIVLTSASFIHQSKIEVEIPTLQEQKEGSIQTESKERIVVIDKEGNYYLDDTMLGLAELKEELGKLDTQTQIVIQGDKQSGLEHFLDLSTTLQVLGFHNVFVITQKNHK